VGLRLVAYASESQVRDGQLCHRSNLFMGFPPEADQVFNDSGIKGFRH
jgi:hypothetical protein